MTPAQKAAETRKQNEAALRERYAERREIIALTKKAMQRIFDNPDATPQELLQAAEILSKLS